MRIALTLFAVALVAVLFTALAGPMLVDWSTWRATFEAELSRRVGSDVEIAGPIDLRLLPTPYLTFRQVAVGGSKQFGEPWLRCDEMRFELAIGALAGGQFRFTEVRLERPIARLASGATDGLRANLVGLARRVELDRVVVEAGRATIERVGAPPLTYSGIALEASAKSLFGPFRGTGELSTPLGAKTRFQFVAGEAAAAALPIKAEIDGGAGGARATFDGKLAWSDGAGSGLRFDGAATFSGGVQALESGAPTPWRFSGRLAADMAHARIDNLLLQLGADSRALEASGHGELGFGAAPALTLTLQSKELNIDAFLRHEGEDSAPPSRLWATLARLTSGAAGPGGAALAVRLALSTPTAILGAQTLSRLTLTASAGAGAPLTGDFEADLPGQSHLRFTGGLEFGAAAELRGRIDARVGDFHSLREWATEDEPEWAARLNALGDALPYGSAAAKGDVEISSVGFSARNLELTLDRSHFVGAIAYTKALAKARARLFLDLYSDGLDIDSAPDLGTAGDWFGDLDLSLSVRASKLRVARVGQATLDGGSLVLNASKSGEKLGLDRLSLADLGGANIEAEGGATPAGRWLRLTLDAAHMRDFAALIARVAPSHYSRTLVERSELLSPAKATFEARRDGPPLEGAFPLDFLRAEGEAGHSRFALKVSRAPAPVDAIAAELKLDSPDAAALLRQIGAKIPPGAAGHAHIDASASGKWETGFDARLAVSASGADLNWRGRLTPDPVTLGDPNLAGGATLKSDNALNLMALLGFAAPNSGIAAPVDLSADVSARGADLALSKISGTLAGAKVAANLAWKAPPEADIASVNADVALAKAIAGEAPELVPARLSGEVSLDKATAGMLLALPLGVTAASRTGARWSDTKFALPLLTPAPSDIRLRITTLDGVDAAPARDFTARLRMDSSKFDLDDISMGLGGGGRVSGRLTIRRDGPEAALTGRIAMSAIGVDRAAMRGRLGATLDFAGTGSSPAALIAGLVGQGEIQLSNAAIPRLDPGALARVMAKTAVPDARIDETNITRALTIELDRQPLNLRDGATPVALNAGVLRVGPIEIPEPAGHATASGEFDLRAFNLDVLATLEEAHGDKFWSGPPPAVIVTSRGSLDAPTRKIDAVGLAAGLAAQAIARESDRIAGLEADMRERAYFNRRLKAEHFLAVREAEQAAYLMEQARLRNEVARKRMEEDAMKAYEEEFRVDPAAPRQLPPVARGSPPPPPTRPKSADPTATGLY